MKYTDGRFGHTVVVIKDREEIFRVEGKNPRRNSKEAQKDLEDAYGMIKEHFGDPEKVILHEMKPDEIVSSVHFKDGLTLFVIGFVARERAL